MILCLGTTPVLQRTMVFERVTTDAVNRAVQVHDYASGKSINAARVLHTLGAQVLVTGFVGGSRGRALCDDLDAAGIRHDLVSVAAETRQCVTVIDRSAGTATELVEESGRVDPESWERLEAKLATLLPTADAWVFSGTLAPGTSPDFYARRLRHRRSGQVAIVDAAGEPLRLAMREAGVIAKMNRQELAAALGEDLTDETALAIAAIRHRPRDGALVVTLGSRGALAATADGCWRAIAPKIQAVSAVGSGDAFAGGLAVALCEGRTFPEALRLAVACGSANALTPLAGHVNAEPVRQLFKQIEIHPVSDNRG